MKRAHLAHLAHVASNAVACSLAVLASSACVVELANIDLVVHQSVDEARRRSSPGNILEVSYVLDRIGADGDIDKKEQDVDAFSFASDADTISPPQRLKPYDQRLTMALAVGGGAGFALADAFAVGRVDPLLIPSLDRGTEVALEARAFLAEPDALEPLDGAVPAGARQAVCDNRAGFVHAIGGVAAYSFDLDDLALVSNEAAFGTAAGADIACDVTDVLDDEGVLQAVEGAVVAAHGVCAGGPGTHTVVLDVGGPRELTLDNQPGAMCDPFVRVVTLADGSSRVWVAAREFAALYAFGDDDVDDGTLLGRQEFNPFLTGPVRHVLLDDGTLIASGSLLDDDGSSIGSIIRRSAADDALQPGVATRGLAPMLAGDPSGEAALFDDGDGTLSRRVPRVDNNVVSYSNERAVAFDAGFVPTRILVLGGDDDDRDNDVVVGMNDVGDVQVEGGVRKPATQRSAFAVAFGRAVILAGNAPGHDVLVRAFDDAEIDLLERRPTD